MIERSRRERGAIAGLACLALAALGVAVGLAAAPGREPAVLSQTDSAQTIPVVVQAFTDDRDVTLRVDYATGVQLHTSRAGRITRARCTPGKSWKSGTTPVWIDGAPVMALATRVPLWRDLRTGDRGPDVSALQDELSRLGQDQQTTGVVGPQTLRNWSRQLGLSRPAALIAASSVIWLPSPATIIADCQVQLGAQSEANAPLATAQSTVASIQVAQLPDDAVAGPRQLMSGDVVAQVDDSGVVTAEDQARQLAASDELRAAAASDGQFAPSARWTLREPLDVAPVPPGALVGLGQEQVCVVSADGEPVPVTIVASLAGRSLVSFGSQAPPAQIQTAPDANSCG